MSSSDVSQPEKMNLESMSISDHQKSKLKELFPEVFTEGLKVDFDQLKRTLGEMVDGGKERFGMQWAGKADCFKTIQQPSLATLVPCPEEGIEFDTTENVFIEGDNLEVLKLLQKSYLGKVKMIYIDPPYNTGNDFIYPDNYSENLDTYLEYTGQIDGEGRKFSTNVDTDGRFHSKWMNMMYPRLFLAKNLLKEDGLIFISIDDNEIKNLRSLCDEIFGEENFIDPIIWKKRYGGGAKEKYLVALHEYVLVYCKNINELDNLFIALDNEQINRYYLNKDEKYEKRGGYRTHPLEAMKSFDTRENLYFSIPAPDGTDVHPKRQWRWGIDRVQQGLEANEIEFKKNRNDEWVLSTKQYLIEETGDIRKTKPFTIIDDVFTQHGTNEILDIFGNAKIFDFPKPSNFVKKIVEIGLNSDTSGIILDFFAGSASSAHAVLKINKEDGGNRKYICVQLPEPTDEKSEAYKAGYNTIAEISKERIRRASAKIQNELIQSIAQAKRDLVRLGADVAKFYDDLLYTLDREEEYQKAKNKVTVQEALIQEKELLLEKIDLGFRVFKLQKSNFSVWDSTHTTDPTQIALQLEQHIDHIAPDASQQAILFELLLKSGYELTTSIETLILANKTVYSIADNALLICLEKELTIEVMNAIAALEPSRVIVLDEGFQNNDQLKTNSTLTLKAKGVHEFRTV